MLWPFVFGHVGYKFCKWNICICPFFVLPEWLSCTRAGIDFTGLCKTWWFNVQSKTCFNRRDKTHWQKSDLMLERSQITHLLEFKYSLETLQHLENWIFIHVTLQNFISSLKTSQGRLEEDHTVCVCVCVVVMLSIHQF